jgi:hypothetical protein
MQVLSSKRQAKKRSCGGAAVRPLVATILKQIQNKDQQQQAQRRFMLAPLVVFLHWQSM